MLFSLLVFGRSFCPDNPELLIKLNTTCGLQVETRMEAKLLYLITHYSIFTVCFLTQIRRKYQRTQTVWPSSCRYPFEEFNQGWLFLDTGNCSFWFLCCAFIFQLWGYCFCHRWLGLFKSWLMLFSSCYDPIFYMNNRSQDHLWKGLFLMINRENGRRSLPLSALCFMKAL